MVQLVGTDRRVLELGPATGHMTRVLRDRGCTVVGIEVDPEMANQAAEFAERVIVGNLDKLDLDEELGSDRFDVIVAADVLEHLTDPLSALRRLRRFLAARRILRHLVAQYRPRQRCASPCCRAISTTATSG